MNVSKKSITRFIAHYDGMWPPVVVGYELIEPTILVCGALAHLAQVFELFVLQCDTRHQIKLYVTCWILAVGNIALLETAFD